MADEGNTVALEVATPHGKALSTEADMVQVPSSAGEFGVLPNHLPILAVLKPGVMKFERDGKTQRAAISSGFVEADATRVRIVTEAFVAPEDVDATEARSDLEAAEARLKEVDGALHDPEQVRAQRQLDWALARVELAASSAN